MDIVFVMFFCLWKWWQTSVQVGAGIMDIVFVMFFLSLEMVANLCAGGGGHHGHSVCYVFCLWKWWQTSVQVGAGIMDIVFVMLFLFLEMVANLCAGGGGHHGHSVCYCCFVFENGCKPLVTSVQVGAGILDIVFVIVVLTLKMVVNLCARGGGHHGHSVCYCCFVFENGCKPLVTSVQVGAGIMDIVFVIVVLSLKMAVNLW